MRTLFGPSRTSATLKCHFVRATRQPTRVVESGGGGASCEFHFQNSSPSPLSVHPGCGQATAASPPPPSFPYWPRRPSSSSLSSASAQTFPVPWHSLRMAGKASKFYPCEMKLVGWFHDWSFYTVTSPSTFKFFCKISLPLNGKPRLLGYA